MPVLSSGQRSRPSVDPDNHFTTSNKPERPNPGVSLQPAPADGVAEKGTSGTAASEASKSSFVQKPSAGDDTGSAGKWPASRADMSPRTQTGLIIKRDTDSGDLDPHQYSFLTSVVQADERDGGGQSEIDYASRGDAMEPEGGSGREARVGVTDGSFVSTTSAGAHHSPPFGNTLHTAHYK